jgi:AcrR family transcriptional regulator
MAVASRKRIDPRREATRLALIEAAESLIAEAGVEGTSTRQIGAAIGSHNTNVVAYHFGSKEALIEEIYRYRLPEIDQRRGELLRQADAAGRGEDLVELVRVFALPWFEQTDSKGQHSFAGFLSGIERSGMISSRGRLTEDFPATDRVNGRMASLLPAAARNLFHFRLRTMTAMILATLQLIDREAQDDPATARRLFDTSIAMAAAATAAEINTQGGENP